MKEALLIFEDSNIQPKEFSIDDLDPLEIEDSNLYGATKKYLNKLSRETTIVKILIAHNTPNAKLKEFRSSLNGCVPAKMILSTTNKLEYEGASKITDVRTKLQSLMPSASAEVVTECFEVFEEIQTSMNAINVLLKQYKPVNSTTQGFIKHHFPSPKFPETSKN